MDRSVVGNRTFDINEDGLAHIGMLPDFIADLQQLGLTEQDLMPLLYSAEGYIQMWEKAERNRAPRPENTRCQEIRGAIQERRDEIERHWEAISQARDPKGRPDLDEIAEFEALIEAQQREIRQLEQEREPLGCLG